MASTYTVKADDSRDINHGDVVAYYPGATLDSMDAGDGTTGSLPEQLNDRYNFGGALLLE